MGRSPLQRSRRDGQSGGAAWQRSGSTVGRMGVAPCHCSGPFHQGYGMGSRSGSRGQQSHAREGTQGGGAHGALAASSFLLRLPRLLLMSCLLLPAATCEHWGRFASCQCLEELPSCSTTGALWQRVVSQCCQWPYFRCLGVFCSPERFRFRNPQR
jgi:hypothetical protein